MSNKTQNAETPADQAALDNYSTQKNPQHSTYHRDRGASDSEAENQAAQKTRSNQKKAAKKK